MMMVFIAKRRIFAITGNRARIFKKAINIDGRDQFVEVENFVLQVAVVDIVRISEY